MSNELKYAGIADTLRGQIDTGALAPGDRLPSFSELRSRFGATQVTVARAYGLLEQEGRIERRQGRGTFVMRRMPRAARIPGASNGLRKTVLVLSGAASDAEAVHRHSGWAASLSFACFDAIRERQRHLLSLDPDQLTAEETEHVLASPPAGVLFPFYGHRVPEPLRDFLGQLRAAGVPIVAYGDSPDLQECERLVPDHAAGSQELTRWLLAHGRRRILRLWDAPADEWWLRQRDAGHEAAMREAGLEPLPPVYMPRLAETAGERALFEQSARTVAGYLIEALTAPSPVDAIMVTSDRLAFAAAAACRLFGRLPGRDVLLAGYDDYAEDCQECAFEAVGPQVTMDKRNGEAGSEMLAMLLARMEGRVPAEPQRRVIAPRLVACS